MNLQNNLLKGGIHYLTSDYYTRNSNRSMHKGMDFVGQTKQDDIIALEDGTVNYIGYDSRSGNWLSIKTNGIEHRYFHLENNSIKVKKNDLVKKGEVIAKMGKTGNATGYNLHFAIYKDGHYVDPLPYLMNNDPFNLNNKDAFTTFIKDLQKALGAKVDGIPGPETLNKTITVSQTINRKHPAVKAIQEYLQALGYDLGPYGIDSTFGPQMSKIIKEYQKNVVGLKGNYIDGVITAKKYTWQKLLNLA